MNLISKVKQRRGTRHEVQHKVKYAVKHRVREKNEVKVKNTEELEYDSMRSSTGQNYIL